MIDSLFFSGFDPLHEVPELCTVCAGRPPVFSYDYHTLDAARNPQKTTGFCCMACATELLCKLESTESEEWAEEEAALAKDDFDVTEFREHRLAAFPGRRR